MNKVQLTGGLSFLQSLNSGCLVLTNQRIIYASDSLAFAEGVMIDVPLDTIVGFNRTHAMTSPIVGGIGLHKGTDVVVIVTEDKQHYFSMQDTKHGGKPLMEQLRKLLPSKEMSVEDMSTLHKNNKQEGNVMEKWTYSYVDGTVEGIEQGQSVEVINESDGICVVMNADYSMTILKRDVVDMQHFTVEKKKNWGKRIVGGALAGLAVVFAPFLGIGVAASLPLLLILKATVLFKGVMIGGVAIGIITGISKKAKEENCFMISYLDESDPENLKVIIVEHGKKNLEESVTFFNEIVENAYQTPKADYVEAFKAKLEAETMDFKFRIDDILSLYGREFSVMGKVEKGSVNLNDEVCILKPTGEIITTVVTEIRVSNVTEKTYTSAETASKDDYAGLILQGLSKKDVAKGDIIYIPKQEFTFEITSHEENDISAIVYVINPQMGNGRVLRAERVNGKCNILAIIPKNNLKVFSELLDSCADEGISYSRYEQHQEQATIAVDFDEKETARFTITIHDDIMKGVATTMHLVMRPDCGKGRILSTELIEGKENILAEIPICEHDILAEVLTKEIVDKGMGTFVMHEQQQESSDPTPTTVLVADEIIKLKGLLDAGVLTQDEFDQKKVQLLNL